MSNVYAAPTADLTLESDETEYATFGQRLAAGMIDGFLMMLVTLPLLYMVYGASMFDVESTESGSAGVLIQYILPVIITILFWKFKDATPGKMLMKIKIVDADTLQPASTGRLLLRYIGYYISMIVVFLGYFWVIWDKKKQGWHDKMGKTLVVKT